MPKFKKEDYRLDVDNCNITVADPAEAKAYVEISEAGVGALHHRNTTKVVEWDGRTGKVEVRPARPCIGSLRGW